MEIKRLDRVSVNKKLCYFLVFLAIIIPIIVGVLVWHLTKQHYTSGDRDYDERRYQVDNRRRQGTRPRTKTVIPPEVAPEEEVFNIPGDGDNGIDVIETFQTTTGRIPTQPWEFKRLSRDVVPIHYDITMYPNFYDGNSWFYGYETIELGIQKDTNVVLFHAHKLNITSILVTNVRTGENVDVVRSFSYPENQYWVVQTSTTLSAGESFNLLLEFDGSLSSNDGIYKSSYLNTDTNATSYFVASKFEPVMARRAFPCFDEPNLKAEFTVRLVHRAGILALSNMPDESAYRSRRFEGNTETQFARSVKMSTYLVCFIVGDFSYVHMTTPTNVQLRVFATPDKIDQARYALAVGNHTMTVFEKLFGIKYPLPKQGKPVAAAIRAQYDLDVHNDTMTVYEQVFEHHIQTLPKLDMIAVPDYVSAAMEHWGLITYRETALLFDENEASGFNKQRVASVIAHEIAHQWFGNIVTMDWWDDLWLNEGFASFMEYTGLKDFEPSWDMESQFINTDYRRAMQEDARLSSHSIIMPINEASDISAVFDSITYRKGASVINMLKNFIGHRDFFMGIQHYLKAFEYGNAKTDDLWNSLTRLPGSPDIKAIMDTWTKQMGFPYINVKIEANGPNTTLKLEQNRFTTSVDSSYDVGESDFGYKWYINAEYITSAARHDTKTIWLNRTDVEVKLPFDIRDEKVWIKFNHNQKGFFRVNYPDFLWRRLASLLRSHRKNELFSVDRAGLLTDAMNLARSGYLSYDVALELTRFLPQETEYSTWANVVKDLQYISDMIKSTSEYSLWRDYLLKHVKPISDRLGWMIRGTHLQRLTRIVLLDLTCKHADPDCLSNARYHFRRWLSEGVDIPSDLKGLAYVYGMQSSGTVSDWEIMWQKYLVVDTPQDRLKLLRGMAMTKEHWLLQRMLNDVRDTNKIKSQDFFTVLIYISRNPIGNTLVWDWVRTNWNYLVERFSIGSRSLGYLVPRVAEKYNSQFQLDQVIEFFRKHPEAGAGRKKRDELIEDIRSNIEWVAHRKPTLVEWLAKNTK